jgi:hypothetical protein
MASLPVGKNDDPRPLFANDLRDFQPVLPSVFDAAVRKIERATPRHPQNPRSLGRFAGPIFGRAASPHFALRQIEDAGSVSALGHFEQRASARLFYIVAMGRNCQNIEWHVVSVKAKSGGGKSATVLRLTNGKLQR